jgi:hypothetical protein
VARSEREQERGSGAGAIEYYYEASLTPAIYYREAASKGKQNITASLTNTLSRVYLVALNPSGAASAAAAAALQGQGIQEGSCLD